MAGTSEQLLETGINRYVMDNRGATYVAIKYGWWAQREHGTDNHLVNWIPLMYK